VEGIDTGGWGACGPMNCRTKSISGAVVLTSVLFAVSLNWSLSPGCDWFHASR